MEQPNEEPKRVTSTEARAKLLRSLVSTAKNFERDKHAESREDFMREILRHEEFSSD